MTTATFDSARGAAMLNFDQASALLRRYPDVSAEESAQLVRFLKEGPPEDVGRITFGSGLDAQVTALKKAHPADFSTGLRVWLPLTMFIAVAAAVLIAIQLLVG